MCEEVKGFPLPNYPGLTIADLIKETDQKLISKVMLEEKLFETWYSGRVVLLGDGNSGKRKKYIIHGVFFSGSPFDPSMHSLT